MPEWTNISATSGREKFDRNAHERVGGPDGRARFSGPPAVKKKKNRTFAKKVLFQKKTWEQREHVICGEKSHQTHQTDHPLQTFFSEIFFANNTVFTPEDPPGVQKIDQNAIWTKDCRDDLFLGGEKKIE